ncbi:hypothetical protein V1514DRAFT_335015 [Lipomyces japonicus]|uniref:uncharacterized protein n=1 Tax=Lipomyces japonicus TaxID=56871 RepID=UPI0034CF25D6
MPPRHFIPRKPPADSTSSSSSGKVSAFDRAKQQEQQRRHQQDQETRAAYDDFVKSFDPVGRHDHDQQRHSSSSWARSGFKSRHHQRANDVPSRPPVPATTDTAVAVDRLLSTRPDELSEFDDRTVYIRGVAAESVLQPYLAMSSTTHVGYDWPAPDLLRVRFRNHDQAVDFNREINGKYGGDGMRIASAVGRQPPPSATAPALSSGHGVATHHHLSAGPFGARLATRHGGHHYGKVAPPESSSSAPPPTTTSTSTLDTTVVTVRYPTTAGRMRMIHAMVEHVFNHGPEFEAAIMARERFNPEFAFLFDQSLPDAVYYRWKLWSLASGEPVDRWDFKPAESIFRDRIVWQPPRPLPSVADEIDRLDDDENDEDNGRDRDRDAAVREWLGPVAHLHLVVLLQHVSMRRGAIARVMAFAIKHAYAAEEIVKVMCKSIIVNSSSTTPQVRIARLWSVGDVLYNSGMGLANKGVWKYRPLFQDQLISVFAGLRQVMMAQFEHGGRIRADNFKRQVLAVVSVWEGWNVFTHAALELMTTEFVGKQPAEPQQSATKPAADMSPAVSAEVSNGRWKKVEKSTPFAPVVSVAVVHDAADLEKLIDLELDGEPLSSSDDEQ